MMGAGVGLMGGGRSIAVPACIPPACRTPLVVPLLSQALLALCKLAVLIGEALARPDYGYGYGGGFEGNTTVSSCSCCAGSCCCCPAAAVVAAAASYARRAACTCSRLWKTILTLTTETTLILVGLAAALATLLSDAAASGRSNTSTCIACPLVIARSLNRSWPLAITQMVVAWTAAALEAETWTKWEAEILAEGWIWGEAASDQLSPSLLLN